MKRDQGPDVGKDGIRRIRNTRSKDAPGGRRATDAEVDRRVEWCAEMLGAKMKSESYVYDAFKKRYHICWSVVKNIYIPRAKKLLQERCRMSRGQARDFGVTQILWNIEHGTVTERNQALKIFGSWNGFDEPIRTVLTGAGGGPVQVADSRPLEKLPTEDIIALAQAALKEGRKGG